MSEQGAARQTSSPARSRLVVACASLLGVMLLALPAFISYGYMQHGEAGIFAAILAGSICTLAGITALASTGLTAKGSPKSALSGALVGMLFRLVIPLVAIVLLQNQGGPLLDAQAVGMLLLYYFLMLAAETGISVWLLRPLSLTVPQPMQTEEKVA